MNITDLIVELLKQGQTVELPGIGTLGTTLQSPYHDSEKGTYFPAHRTPVFDSTTTGDEHIVDVLAERECIGTEVARQMWKNYMDALSDKLHRSGSHTFGELGSLHIDGDKVRFETADGLMLSVGDEKPLEHVKTYSHNDDDDPFARFYAEGNIARTSEPKQKPEPEPVVLEPEPVEPEPTIVPEPIAEPEPEPEPNPEPVTEQEVQPEPTPAPEEPVSKTKAVWDDELKKLEEMSQDNTDDKDKKRKCRWWLWLLLPLLLLLLAGVVYYLLTHRSPKTETTPVEVTYTKHLTDIPATNSLTYNYDLLEYDSRDIKRNSDLVSLYMADYIENYLAYRHFTGARVPMMDRVRQYITERLEVLLADRFAIQRLIPHNDYIYNHNEPWMKQVFAARQRVTVQSELLDMKVLDGILDQLTAELGLEPDAGAPRTAEQVQQVKAEERKVIEQRQKKEETAPIQVNVEQESKQGFDIIAGFYLDRNSAARLTARLHELGSDAYIIEKNNMYYVSMGSAKNRTAAEALFKHIKSWYDGDVAIKQW